MLWIQKQVLIRLFLLVITMDLIVKALSQNFFRESLLLIAYLSNTQKPIENNLLIILQPSKSRNQRLLNSFGSIIKLNKIYYLGLSCQTIIWLYLQKVGIFLQISTRPSNSCNLHNMALTSMLLKFYLIWIASTFLLLLIK